MQISLINTEISQLIYSVFLGVLLLCFSFLCIGRDLAISNLWLEECLSFLEQSVSMWCKKASSTEGWLI